MSYVVKQIAVSSVNSLKRSEINEDVMKVEEVLATGFVTIEIGVDAEYSQICGSSVIFDLSNVTLKKLAAMCSTKILSVLARGLQDAWPHRVNGLHMVNEPTFFTVFYNIFKSMLSKKIRNRFHLHGKDLESLHKFFPVEILPKQLGGTAGEKEFEECQSSILERQKLGEKLTEFVYKGVKC
ncbi:UNVERIFIED_CONTAM: Ttpal [Trichonephila clavipes]